VRARQRFFIAVQGRTMDRMAGLSTHLVQKARDHVARSAYLIDRQEAIIQTLERSGADTGLACALLYTMYRSRLLMIEYLDQLKRVDSPGRKVARLESGMCMSIRMSRMPMSRSKNGCSCSRLP
jgi:hypothetical protein